MEQTRRQRDLQLRPSNTPSDVMRLTPCLTIGQHHGGGKANRILFRGFEWGGEVGSKTRLFDRLDVTLSYCFDGGPEGSEAGRFRACPERRQE